VLAFGFTPKQSPLSVAQRKLWQRLNDYIRQEGGWTVSEPNVSPIRFECPLDSQLPSLLIEAGHRVISYGRHERLTPVSETRKQSGGNTVVTTQQVGFGVAGVWQFDLPFG
jgi:hypothetical protein